jgi:putative DNA primase/helicase
MCDELEAVQIALELGVTVSTACCKAKDPATRTTMKCAFFHTCSYQLQKAVQPDVWIVAHQLLFTAQAALGEPAGVFIDEGFWQAGLWTARRGLTLDEIEAPLPLVSAKIDIIADLEPSRRKLARALRRQSALGGVEHRNLVDEGLTADECTAALALEWRFKERAALWPGMPAADRRKAAQTAKGAKHIRGFANTWAAARELLRQENTDAVSGRLFLTESETDHGTVRMVRAQGAKAIAAQWRAPTLIMDATLPGLEILRVFYPSVEVLADIDATLPHVEVRQVLGAPVSANKLIRGGVDANRNLKAIRRAILYRHLEVGRADTLVIAQKAVAEWLKASGLPAGVAVEHFNNVAGLDRYKGVRLLITIGRTLPDVLAVEANAGALTGLEPIKTQQPEKGPRWFDRVTRGIRCAGGKAVAVYGDQHPDPVGEAVRWQICEGELLQAIGRARGVNRSAETPLTIEIWADVVLPMTVNQVVPWAEVPSGAEIEMLAEGVWLDSPSDMAKAWPDVWESEAAAKQWRDRFTRSQNPIEDTLYRTLGPCGRYQLPGARQRWRMARFNLSLVPTPERWLTERLGPLAGFELMGSKAD